MKWLGDPLAEAALILGSVEERGCVVRLADDGTVVLERGRMPVVTAP